MGDCAYCGEPAGMLRSQHAECRERHDIAAAKIPQFFGQWFDSPLGPDRFRELASEVARTHFVDETKFRELAKSGFAKLIEKALADHLLSEEEEKKIAVLLRTFEMTLEDLPPMTSQKLIKCGILRDLETGIVPNRVNINGNIPINLGRDEKIIWIFKDTTYFTTRTRTRYEGGSQGVSIRIMKGVYYRVGAHKGQSVRTEYLSEEGNGILALTNKAIYFYTSPKLLKIPAKKIIGVEAYDDGITITRESTNPKPQIFKIDDPWFAANVITRLDEL
jgi:hypothetical protein